MIKNQKCPQWANFSIKNRPKALIENHFSNCVVWGCVIVVLCSILGCVLYSIIWLGTWHATSYKTAFINWWWVYQWFIYRLGLTRHFFNYFMKRKTDMNFKKGNVVSTGTFHDGECLFFSIKFSFRTMSSFWADSRWENGQVLKWQAGWYVK